MSSLVISSTSSHSFQKDTVLVGHREPGFWHSSSFVSQVGLNSVSEYPWISREGMRRPWCDISWHSVLQCEWLSVKLNGKGQAMPQSCPLAVWLMSTLDICGQSGLDVWQTKKRTSSKSEHSWRKSTKKNFHFIGIWSFTRNILVFTSNISCWMFSMCR